MDHYNPCFIWAEKLAMRQEDLSPADRAALAAHVCQCRACAAVQAEYQFFDAQLHALPSPAIKPLPRLFLYCPGASVRSASPNKKEGAMSVSRRKPPTSASEGSTPEFSSTILPEQEAFRQHLRRLVVSAVQVLIEQVMREELE